MASFVLPSRQLGSVLKWLLVFAGFAVGQILLVCPRCLLAADERTVRMFLYSYALFLFLWVGNAYLGHYLNRIGSWVQYPLRRFLLSLLCSLIYSAAVILLINWVYHVLLRGSSFAVVDSPELRWTMLSQLLITFFITMTVHAIAFLRGWRESAVMAERLQKEHARSRYEALKNQVNPHFLFNSLNALASLVHPSPDLAVTFIKQLAEVYRYVLDSQHKEVVPLEEELQFAQRYVFLQKIRHADGLQVALPESLPAGWHLPPLALQILLENAIKHNRILAKEPLQVSVAVEGGMLVVQNTLQPKTQHEPPSGLGLPNIQARYAMLTSKPVEIIASASQFTVRLPLLTFQG